MYDNYETIEFERLDGGVLLVAFNRPDQLNAMSAVFHAELASVFADVAADIETRAVVLTGRGRAFSAGGDLEWIKTQPPEEVTRTFREARKIITDFIAVPQPIVAAVNGPAMGLGCTLAILSDIAYAGNDTVMADPHVAIGLVAGDGGALMWPLLAGMARAKRYLLTGDAITGEQAEAFGLIAEATDTAQVLPSAIAMATRLASMSVDAVQGSKRTLNAILADRAGLTLDLGLAAELLTKRSSEHLTIMEGLVAERERRRTNR